MALEVVRTHGKDIGELRDKRSYNKIEKQFPQAEFFQVNDTMCIGDNGLVENIMKEIIDKNYSFSVIDCNSFVKSSWTCNSYIPLFTFEEKAFYKPEFII